MSGRVYRSANASGSDPALDNEGIGAGTGAAPGIASAADPTGVEPEPAGAETGSVMANSAVMALGSLVSRGTGFLRTAAIAAALGGVAVGNAYGNAQFFPGMIYELLLGGILSSVLVPVLVRRRKADPDGGEAYTQRLLTLAVLALGVATAVAVLAAPLLTAVVAGRTQPEARDLLTQLSYLMLPMIFFTGLSALFGAVLNTRGHFAAPMWAPILNNLVVTGAAVAFLLIFGSGGVTPREMGPGHVALIGGGTLLGIAVQALGLLPALRRVGFRWRWRGGFRALGLNELGRLGAWMLCYVGVSQVGVLVLLNVLNRASGNGESAGVAIYNNVYLLMMMAHGIVAVSIITALMPRMSGAAADGRHADLADDLARGTRTSIAVLAPVSVVYAVLALPIAVTLFERANFTRLDAERSAPLLLAAGIALVPFAISQLFTFVYYAMTDTKTPALINIPVVLLRIVVQIGLFVAIGKTFAATGTMIGNGVSYLAAILLSAWPLRARIGRIGLRGIVVTIGRVLVASAGAAVVGLLALRLLPGGDDPTRWQALLQLIVGGLVIGLTYLALAVALRVREITEVVAMVRRRLGR